MDTFVEPRLNLSTAVATTQPRRDRNKTMASSIPSPSKPDPFRVEAQKATLFNERVDKRLSTAATTVKSVMEKRKKVKEKLP